MKMATRPAMPDAAVLQDAGGARARRQFARYAFVGLVSNLILYVGYLALTRWGLGPKTAMTAVYALGILATFTFNSIWTFGRGRPRAASFVRYVVTYGVGYVLNLVLLWLFVDRLDMPHYAVQAASIVAVACVMFALNKFWVFARRPFDGVGE